MSLLAAIPFLNVADVSAATNSIHSYVVPVLSVLDGLAGLLCTLVLIYGGYLYMTSSADPGRLQHAKRILRNGIIGLIIVLAASSLTAVLHHAYTAPAPGSKDALPSLSEVQPQSSSNAWGTILIDALSGLFSSIVTSMYSPLLHELAKLTAGTPTMSTQDAVFNLWLVILGIANVLFVLVLTLLGFRVMSTEMLGLGEVELRSMMPQIGLAFLLMNISIFAIDAVIGLSNAIISAIYAGFPGTDIWKELISSMSRLSGLPLVSLLLFVVFVILSIMLLVYYVARLIMLFLGAAMSPLVILLWLLPGFRDFANNLIRTYLVVIFVLLVHVVILMLGASLLSMQNTGTTGIPNPIMVIIIGISTLFLLLRSQSVLVQMSMVSSGANSTRKLGNQFAGGMRYTADKIDSHAGKELADIRGRYALAALRSA